MYPFLALPVCHMLCSFINLCTQLLHPLFFNYVREADDFVTLTCKLFVTSKHIKTLIQVKITAILMEINRQLTGLDDVPGF